MTEQRLTCVPQFYLTPAAPCPYLPGQMERKVFARLEGPLAQGLNNALTQSGFRRSQSIAYKPTCQGCHACISIRIPVGDFVFSSGQRRILHRNRDIVAREVSPQATREQYALLRSYLDARHASGGMNDMTLFDYAAMVEETPVKTRIFEYRQASPHPSEMADSENEALPATGTLAAAALTDILSDGLSMVYSFFHPGLEKYSPGTFMILDHIRLARTLGLPYVYLGYWVAGCRKMQYKARFTPFEALMPEGWIRHDTTPEQIPPAPDQNGEPTS